MVGDLCITPQVRRNSAMRYRYPTENSPFLDSGFRRNNGYAEVSVVYFSPSW